jgi:hypothetical protein
MKRIVELILAVFQVELADLTVTLYALTATITRYSLFSILAKL